jgi:hypothetical protein
MKAIEVNLASPQKIEVSGATFTLAREDFAGKDDALCLTLPSGEESRFLGAADVSELIDDPRIHILTGAKSDEVLIFGGERALRLSSQGVTGEIATFREWRFAEYFATDFFSCEGGMLIVYESGVMLVDEALAVRWHDPKYFNDIVHRVSNGVITLLRDEELEWTIALTDGATSISKIR